jgi:hypothetical protein
MNKKSELFVTENLVTATIIWGDYTADETTFNRIYVSAVIWVIDFLNKLDSLVSSNIKLTLLPGVAHNRPILVFSLTLYHPGIDNVQDYGFTKLNYRPCEI